MARMERANSILYENVSISWEDHYILYNDCNVVNRKIAFVDFSLELIFFDHFCLVWPLEFTTWVPFSINPESGCHVNDLLSEF